MTAEPDRSRWAAAGVAAVLLVFVVDRLTSANVALVTLSAAGPLIAAVGGSQRATAGVALLAVALALAERFGAALAEADAIGVLDVYAAREQPVGDC